MPSPTTYYTLDTHSRFRAFGDEGVLLRQEQGEVLALNEVATSLMHCLTQAPYSTDMLVQKVTETFAVQQADALADVKAFLSELCELGIVKAQSTESKTAHEHSTEQSTLTSTVKS